MKTGGYEAEFGQATGGVVNVVTKSGTNTLRGTAFGYVRPDGLESDLDAGRDAERHGEHRRRRSCRDVGVEAGGPIVHEPAVLLRRDRPAVGDADVHRAGRIPAARASARSIASGRSRRTPQRGRGRRRRTTGSTPRSSATRRRATSGRSAPPRCCERRPLDSASSSSTAATTRPSATTACSAPHWLVEASFARALNQIVEMPSVDEWNVTDTTVTPQRHHRRHRLLRAGQPQPELPVSGEGDEHHRRTSGASTACSSRTSTTTRSTTAPARRSRSPDGEQTATGATIQIIADPAFGQIYRVTRANLNTARSTDAALHELLRPGHVAGRRPADDPSRHPLRAAGARRARWSTRSS